MRLCAPLCSQYVDVSEVPGTSCCIRGIHFLFIQPCPIGGRMMTTRELTAAMKMEMCV